MAGRGRTKRHNPCVGARVGPRLCARLETSSSMTGPSWLRFAREHDLSLASSDENYSNTCLLLLLSPHFFLPPHQPSSLPKTISLPQWPPQTPAIPQLPTVVLQLPTQNHLPSRPPGSVAHPPSRSRSESPQARPSTGIPTPALGPTPKAPTTSSPSRLKSDLRGPAPKSHHPHPPTNRRILRPSKPSPRPPNSVPVPLPPTADVPTPVEATPHLVRHPPKSPAPRPRRLRDVKSRLPPRRSRNNLAPGNCRTDRVPPIL
jgi:hypothetical protein